MWDDAFLGRVADAISTEARAKYNASLKAGDHSRYHGLTFWSPNINIFRDPRWGRGQETYGEDPFLTSRLGVAFVRGMQGNDPNYLKVVATPKHFDVHSGPEPLRHGFNVDVSERDLDQTYLPAFQATIVQGKAFSVMCAYNAVDGVPACANTMLLEDRLRGKWGFSGYVVSDCGAIGDISSGHKFEPNREQGAAAAVLAGTDLSCGTEYRTLVQAVADGLVTEKDIDQAVRRLFTRAHPSGPVRSARAGAVQQNSAVGQRFTGTPSAGVGGSAKIHCPFEEQQPDIAVTALGQDALR